MTQDWKEQLQSEIMEEYIFLAEMKQHAKDKTAHMIKMREQWDKLCNFIEEERNAILEEVKKDLLDLTKGIDEDGSEYVACQIDYIDIENLFKRYE